MAIGDRLKEERSRLGFSQTDLGAAGGVGKTTQINYEKGDRSPDASYLAAVAEKGVDILYVVMGERRSHSPVSLSEEEVQLLDRYRQMSDAGRLTLTSVSEALATFKG